MTSSRTSSVGWLDWVADEDGWRRVRDTRSSERPGLARPAAGSTSTSTARRGPGSAHAPYGLDRDRRASALPGVGRSTLLQRSLDRLDGAEPTQAAARTDRRHGDPSEGQRPRPVDPELLSRVQFALTASFHLHLPAHLDGPRADARRDGHRLPADEGPQVAPAVVLLGEDLRHRLRDGRRDRRRPGIRVRHELGRLLALRGQRVREPARGGGRLRLHARRWLPRAHALRRQSTRSASVALLDLHGHLRGAFQRALDHDGQRVDADPRRLHDRADQPPPVRS